MLHQKGVQRIEIIVKKEGGSADTGAKEVDAENVGAKESGGATNIFGSNDPNRQKRVIKTNTTHILAVGKQIAGLTLEYYIAGLGNRNGDQAHQDQVQRTVEIVEDATNIASSTAMGAVYGAWGGPIGAVLGAAMGLVSSSASTIAKYFGREREFNYKVFKENNAIEYQRARASINLTTGRLR